MSEPSGFDCKHNGLFRGERELTDYGCNPFRLKAEPSGPAAGEARQVLTISGELDLATAPQLERALRLASGTVLIDCRSLCFMDAAGVRVLEEALGHVDRIQLMNVGSRVRRVITIVGLAEEFLESNGLTHD
jgi:anti-anti-sigma factor